MSMVVSAVLDPEMVKEIDKLVKELKAKSRSEVIRKLVKEGLKNKNVLR